MHASRPADEAYSPLIQLEHSTDSFSGHELRQREAVYYRFRRRHELERLRRLPMHYGASACYCRWSP